MTNRKQNTAYDYQIWEFFHLEHLNANQTLERLAQMNVKVSRDLVYSRWRKYQNGNFNPQVLYFSYDDMDIDINLVELAISEELENE